ncbi:PDCD5-related protein [Polychytrium aggregatum]|uniref:PDCD5-related protein n=1 Tax=Polychytrium aggregatum TaxID=110093 RepID=UPI0022FED39A|nr:PDCD5-related protein [Polychytrium aggregatum]KAI9206414.1 PDCD5-related protein [Polychytrium aggregatum]
MEDDELQAIRARRLQEMKAARGGQGAGGMSSIPGLPGSGSGGGSGSGDAEKAQQMEEMRRTLLVQILDNGARERLSRISIVKADKARAVEDMLIRMAQSGQLRGKVDENQLIEMLGQIAEQSESRTKITYNRRRVGSDDDDDDFDL